MAGTTRLTFRTEVPVSAQELYDWHARPSAFLRLQPPWENVRIDHVTGPLADGQKVTISAAALGPIRLKWLAEIYDVQPGVQFCDRQLRGPFAEWNHRHRMIAHGSNGSILHDEIDYRLPFGLPGRLLGGNAVRKRLETMFAYRHALTVSDLKRQAQFRHLPRQTVAVTGSTGLVGTDLCQFLVGAGHRVVRLTRQESRFREQYDGTESRSWNPYEPIDPKLFEDVDAVIHLAGENVAAGRWTEARKGRIRDSRIGPTRNLAEAVGRSDRTKVLISASAIGFYGDRGDELLDEQSSAGTGFFAEIGQAWEAATEPAQKAGKRVVIPRVGMVLSPKGGALAKQLPAFQLGGGAVLGAGTQYISWITIHDLVGLIHFALMSDHVHGPLNGVGPNPITNREFGRVLARVLYRPYLMTIPAPMLRLIFGQLADEALLASNRILPRKAEGLGFHYEHKELEAALRFLLGR